MKSIKARIRSLLGIEPQSGVTPLEALDWVGSETHGYVVPRGLLGPESLCYCVGAGEDITFDTELAEIYGSRIVVIDPTPEGRKHFAEVGAAVASGAELWSRNGKPFRYRIAPQNFQRLSYVAIGVWDEAKLMRFYEPTRDNYPSHSVVMFQESGSYIELPVDRLSRIMAREGHRAIDLLKLEIEGAEYRVIETIIEDRPDIKSILVEYDEVYHSRGRAALFRIRNSSRRLIDAGYRLAHSTPMYKRLFVREDVFQRLAEQKHCPTA